jgi:2'-hydroxyisoflavone reductase
MNSDRRQFVQLSLLAGVGAGLASSVEAQTETTARADRALKILVLGGTGLIGPPLVRYARSRGHHLTLFNRGKTNTHLFPLMEKLRGDRNDDLASLEAEVAKGRRWDVVIDNTASIPRWVGATAGLLKDSAETYLFTSSISAYAEFKTIGADESAPTATISLEDESAVKSTKDITGENYGALKARCEEEAHKAFPDRCIVVRPGLIVGPGDYSDRFTYWPVRVAKGGEVMAPGNPDDPVQFIDCRDLGEWFIRLVEEKRYDTFNGVGPRSPMSIGGMLHGMRATIDNEITFTWVEADFLAEHEVQPWRDMTVWVPPVGEEAGFSTASIEKAKAAGLTFRPLAETTKATLKYWATLPEDRRAKPRAGLASDRETTVLAAWHARKTS